MKETFFESIDIIAAYFQNIIDLIMGFNYSKFFIEIFSNLGMKDFWKIVLIYVFVLWVAIIIWVTRDILSRSNSIIMQFFSILLIAFGTPILGLPIYFIIRPSRKKYDEDEEVYEELYEEVDDDSDNKEETQIEKQEKKNSIEEIIKREKLTANFEKMTCYNCHYHIEEDFKFCPDCEIRLKDNCEGCFKEIKTNWKICPYCGKKIDSQLKSNSEELLEEKKEKKKNKKVKNKNKEKKGFFSSFFSENKETVLNTESYNKKEEKNIVVNTNIKLDNKKNIKK